MTWSHLPSSNRPSIFLPWDLIQQTRGTILTIRTDKISMVPTPTIPTANGQLPMANGRRVNPQHTTFAFTSSPRLSSLANAYDASSAASASNANASAYPSAADAAAMSQMDPAWLAYYQSMNYYSMMQSGMAGAAAASSGASTSATATKPTDSTAPSDSSASAAGQPDYSQQWIEYYRSMGQNEFADEITRQMKQVRRSFSYRRSLIAAFCASLERVRRLHPMPQAHHRRILPLP